MPAHAVGGPSSDADGDAFVLRSRWKTLQASGRVWTDMGLAREALVHRRPNPRGPVRVLEGGQLGARDHEWSLWRDGATRTRSEFSISREPVTVVTEPGRWWRSSPVLGSTSGALSTKPVGLLLGPPGILVDGDLFLGQLEILKTTSATLAGRPVTVLSARPTGERTPGRFFLREAGLGADLYTVSVDTEYEAVLGVTASRAGEVFRIIEATSIDFDAAIPASVFALPQRTVEVRTPARARHSAHGVADTLRERFVVLEPVDPPSAAPPHVAVFDGDRRGPGAERLVMTYAVTNAAWGRGQLRITQSGHDLPRSFRDEWRSERDLEFSNISYGRTPRRRIRTRRFGTFVEVDSTVVPFDALLEVLDSLRPEDSA